MSLVYKTDVEPIIKRLELESEIGDLIHSGTLRVEIFHMVEEGKSYNEILNYCIKTNELFKTKEFKEKFTKDLIYITEIAWRKLDSDRHCDFNS